MTTATQAIDPMTLPPVMWRCLPDYRPGKYKIERPFVLRGYVYCTDGHILGRTRRGASDTPGDYPDVTSYESLLDAIGSVKNWVSADDCLQLARRKGLDPYRNSPRLVAPVGNAWIALQYAAMLAKRGVDLEVVDKKNGPIRWRWGEPQEWECGGDEIVHGVLMPVDIE